MNCGFCGEKDTVLQRRTITVTMVVSVDCKMLTPTHEVKDLVLETLGHCAPGSVRIERQVSKGMFCTVCGRAHGQMNEPTSVAGGVING